MSPSANVRYLVFIFVTSGLLPAPVQCKRDEDQYSSLAAEHQMAADIQSRAMQMLQVRGDGKQVILKPEDGAAADAGGAADNANATATDAPSNPSDDGQGDKGTKGDTLQMVKDKFDPRKHGVIRLLQIAFVLTCLSFVKRVLFPPSCDDAFQIGKKKSRGIEMGTVLVCINYDREDDRVTASSEQTTLSSPRLNKEASIIFEEIGSEKVVGSVPLNEEVTVAGPPKQASSGKLKYMMVPIQYGIVEGVVKLEHFCEPSAVNVKAGTFLTCTIGDTYLDGTAEVFLENTDPSVVLGQIHHGEKVVARDKVIFEKGRSMVPVRPRGVVELQFFAFREEDNKVEEDEEIEGLAGWTTEQLEGDAEVLAKVKLLKLERTRLLMEQTQKSNTLRQIKDQMEELEDLLDGKGKATDEEIAAQEIYAVAQADLAAKRNVLLTAAYAAPLFHQSQKIYSAVEDSMDKLKQKALHMALEEGRECLMNLQGVLGFKNLFELEAKILNDVNIPSVASVLASIMAPFQLRVIFSVQSLNLTLSMIFVLMDAITVVRDFRVPCATGSEEFQAIPQPTGLSGYYNAFTENCAESLVYMWFVVDLFVHMTCACIRGAVLVRLYSRMGSYAKPPEVDANKNPAEALRTLYDFYTSSGTIALVELDTVMSSFLVYLTQWSVVYDACWLIYGIDVIFGVAWLWCQTTGLFILRIRVCIFLSLWILYVIQIGLFAMSTISQSKTFTLTALAAADRCDHQHFLGLPLAKVLVHALLVRHSADLISIQLEMQRTEQERIQIQREEAERKLEELQAEWAEHDEQIASLAQRHLEVGGQFQECAVLQEQYDEMHGQMVEKSSEWDDKVRTSFYDGSKRAEEIIDQIDKGEGLGDIVGQDNLQRMERMRIAMQDVDTNAIAAKAGAAGLPASLQAQASSLSLQSLQEQANATYQSASASASERYPETSAP